jgi:hypothetical protein
MTTLVAKFYPTAQPITLKATFKVAGNVVTGGGTNVVSETMTGDKVLAFSSGYQTIATLDSNGAARNVTVSGTYPAGYRIIIQNIGSYPITFNGMILIGAGQQTSMTYNGSAWYALSDTFYFPNAAAADQGAAGTRTLYSIKAAVGVNVATIIFRHTGVSATTVYTVGTSLSLPANISIIIEQGAIVQLANGVTLTILGPANIGEYQAFTFTGTGQVLFSTLTPKVSATWTGFATGATAAANTTALRKAVLSTAGTSYAIDAIKAGQILTGIAPILHTAPGKYEVNDNIPYSQFTRIQGEQTIIYQTDAAKDIFWSESPYANSFKGLVLIGGKTQIYAMNGASGAAGLESVRIDVDCEHHASADYAFQALFSGVSGGMDVTLRGKYINCKKAFKFTGDNITILPGTWIASYNDAYWDNDTAQIYNGSNMNLDNVVFVPGGTYNVATDFRRWIDNYGYRLILEGCRFGAEGGGVPLVYNFTDMLGEPSVYPYLDGGIVSIRNSQVSAGGTSKLDRGLIVAKSGLPSSIILDGNYYAADAVFIRCDLMTGGTTLATYLATVTAAHQPTLGINVVGNSVIATTLTESAANDLLLQPWLKSNILYYDAAATYYGQPRGNMNLFGNLTANNIIGTNVYGKSYATTSISPAAPNDTIAIVDTGIVATPGAWLLTVIGNMNPGGSSAYRQTITGIITINYGTSALEIYFQPLANTVATGISALTVTPAISSSQIRISIGAYTAGVAGSYQTLRMFRLI